jgi:small subunit ribosomal protein S6
MAKPAPTYDLMLLLDPQAEDDRRQKILDDTRALVARQGEVVNEQDWGQRPLAYEIRHKQQAEYHLLQFHGPRELLSELEHTLRITDGVTRFRIIKLAPGTPAPQEPRRETAAPETADISA